MALVPGTVLAALVAPAVFREGAARARRSRRHGRRHAARVGLLLPVAAGVAAVFVLRALLGQPTSRLATDHWAS